MRLPEPLIFLLDRAVPGALSPALLEGEDLVLLDDRFAPDTRDAVWIPEVGAQGWVIVTKDTAMKRNPLEKRALLAANTAVFFFANGGLPGHRLGEALAHALPGMRRAIRRFDVPILGRVNATGEITVSYANGEEQRPPPQLKVHGRLRA